MTITEISTPEPGDTIGPRLRLLKIIVQPMFVVDDGITLIEQPGQAVEVPAAQWSTFGATAFNAEEMAQLQASYDAAQVAPDPVDVSALKEHQE